jgi:hypothetical protein
MTLRDAIEHLMRAAERNGDADVVGWCAVALAAVHQTHQDIVEKTETAVVGRWRICKSAVGGWRRNPRDPRHPFKVFATFGSQAEAQRVADAFNAIEAERAEL